MFIVHLFRRGAPWHWEKQINIADGVEKWFRLTVNDNATTLNNFIYLIFTENSIAEVSYEVHNMHLMVLLAGCIGIN